MFDGGWSFQKGALLLAVGAVLWAGGRWAFYTPPLHECGPFPNPVQVEIAGGKSLDSPPGYQIRATDTYDLEALVVSAARYHHGAECEFAPVDLALAWGPLTTRKALDAVHYAQDGRWYSFEWKNTADLPVSYGDIVCHSANTHLVIPPGRDDLRDAALMVRRGDTVKLSGYLVQITGPGGWRWNSSRTRGDQGAHACEVVYVTRLVIE